MAAFFDPASQLHPTWERGPSSGQSLYKNAAATNGIGQTFSLLQAAEELAFNFVDKAEEKTLDERTLRKYEQQPVPSLLKINALLQTMRDAQAATYMQELAENRHSSVLAMLNQASEDPSKQYLLAAGALNLAHASSAKASTVETLRDVFEHLGNHHASAVFAGINTVEQAAAFAPDQSGVDRFRNTYRDAVLGQLTFPETFRLLLERFGDGFERGVSLLRQALGADLAALRPSCGPTRLHAILQDLCHLAATVSVLQHCRKITEQLQRTGPMQALQPLQLMQDLVAWVAEPWIMGYHVTQLIDKYLKDEHKDEHKQGRNNEDGDMTSEDEKDNDEENRDEENRDEQAKYVFLNGVLEILRGLPDRFFSSGEHRLQAVAAVLAVLDAWLLMENDED